jgi:tetratricopeptide (TPR) repeat protein
MTMSLELVTLDQWNEALVAGQVKWKTTGFLPDIFRAPWSPLYEYFGYFQVDCPPMAEEIEEAFPAHDLSDRVQRALVASMICAMIQTAEEQADNGDSAMLCALLRRYLAVSYTAPNTLADLRWEIQAGLAARDLRRVSSSCRQWLDFDPEAETLEVAADSAFAAISNLEVSRGALDPAWRSPFLPEGTDSDVERHVARGTMFVWATTFHPLDPLYPPPLEPSILRHKVWSEMTQAQGIDPWTGVPSQQDRHDRNDLLGVCLSLLHRLGPDRVNRLPHLAAFSAWCDLAVGVQEKNPDVVAQAAAKYAQIAGAGWAAVDCYLHVGMFADAEREIRRCMGDSPDATAYRRLSEVLYKQERIPEAVEAFETHVRLKENQQDSWLDSLTLRLGLESQQRRTVLLEAAAERAVWAPMGQQLAEWIQPWFRHLCPDAKRRWWTGLYVLSAPEFCANLGEASVWEMAADAFGEAVAMELRHSVLRPFREAHPGEPSTTPLPDHWKKAREGNATLGNLMHCLVNAKYPPLPVGRSFSAWLQQHRKSLFEYICRRDVDLLRLAKLRGAAQHDTVTQAEARQVFEDAAGLLQHLVSD